VSEPETDLIEAIRNGLPPGVEFDEREETLLSLAARQARDVERAEADLEERGYLPESTREAVRSARHAAGARWASAP
jgi:hypothetical protein